MTDPKSYVLAHEPTATAMQSPSRDGIKIWFKYGGVPCALSSTCDSEAEAWREAAEAIRLRRVDDELRGEQRNAST